VALRQAVPRLRHLRRPHLCTRAQQKNTISSSCLTKFLVYPQKKNTISSSPIYSAPVAEYCIAPQTSKKQIMLCKADLHAL
jgi:hypothetical protein